MTGAELRAWRLRRSGSFVRHRREVAGWTQEEAARWYGVSTRTWQFWEARSGPVPTPVERRTAAYELEETLSPADRAHGSLEG